MIYFDTTCASGWSHSSGLARVSRRLRDELGGAVTAADWGTITARAGKGDWVLTPELFSEEERPGIGAFLERRTCRVAAIYHDAIPLRYPEFTWPRSVERHPGYMKLLSKFDRVWAVSKASQRELLSFWNWQGILNTPPVDVLQNGADGLRRPRQAEPLKPHVGRPRIVAIGILEPRKNQDVLLQAGIELRLEGLDFELHVVGRVNPHFGKPVLERLRTLQSAWTGLVHHKAMGDDALVALLRSARATAFPSLAEGCGLPVLESLWLGVPCLTSDIPPVLENAAGGGCLVVRGEGHLPWKAALRSAVTDAALTARLSAEARSRALPTWSGAASALLAGLS